MAQFHSLRIKEIIKETADAVSILFDVPSQLKADFRFIPGQYITIKKEMNGSEIRRSYSICSSPTESYLRIAVKKVEDGLFSTFAVHELKEGDFLNISPPEGRFILEINNNNENNYVAFAAGSGITPILSMIKDVLENEKKSHFYLVFGNKTPQSTIFKNNLEALKAKHENFHWKQVYSQVDEENALFGHIDTGNINYFIKNIWKDVSFNNAFLCGPEQMIETASNTLQENGFSKDAILFELFTSSSTSEENTAVSDGMSTVKVILDDETFTVTMDAKNRILDTLLANDIDAPYSCQGGVCSSCLAKVTKGSATMDKNTILTDGEIEEGLILTCQAHPTSPDITIDFDDV